MLHELKALVLDRISLEELISYLAFAKTLHAEFDAVRVETPEWLDSRIRELKREIQVRASDSIEKRLREAKARLETLKPAEQRREELAQEVKRLEGLLAK